MTIRVGAQIFAQYSEYESIRAAWVAAEELGADVLMNTDHFFAIPDQPNAKHLECWTLLAAMAEVTERIEIGPLVACNSYRNPDLHADMARTVDNISNGRLIFGIGSGWHQRDYDEYGYEFGTAASRLDDLEAALPVIGARLEKLRPLPRRKIPLLIGGDAQRVLRIAARHADIWHGSSGPDTMRRKSHQLDQFCADAGRDPREIERSCGMWNFAEGCWQVDRAEEFADAGFTFFTIRIFGPQFDLGRLRELLAFRDERNKSSAGSATHSGPLRR